MNNHDGELVKVLCPKWLLVTGPVWTELLIIVRMERRPLCVDHEPPLGRTETVSTSWTQSTIAPEMLAPTLSA